MNCSTTRMLVTLAVFAGATVGGESVAAAASLAGRCQPSQHAACLSDHRTTAALMPYWPERLRSHRPNLLIIAMHRSARPRIVVYPSRPYPALEHGAIYGYAPGYYQVGQNGVLYGPYPLNPNAPAADLRY